MESSFVSIGLSELKAKETAKNAKLSANLVKVIDRAKGQGHVADLTSIGPLLYTVAVKMKPQIFHLSDVVVDYICRGQLDNEVRVMAAIDYLIKNQQKEVDLKAFESACGIGIVVTAEQIEKAVEEAIKKEEKNIMEKRYRFNSGIIMTQIRTQFPWADGKRVKAEVDLQILDLLGPKTEADLAPPPKEEKKKKKDGGDKAKKEAKVNGTTEDTEEDGASTIAELMKTKVKFHKPGENDQTDLYVVTPKTKQILAEHLKRTGGQVRTRFPPEPNGLLHIGHAKAININFGYAAAHNGTCYLRYDDTNPEKEEEKFFTGIRDVVEWLGYKPAKITHSSDNFHQLYEWAKVLIEKDLAYVCHQRVEDIRGFNPPPSPYRTRPVHESRQLFEDMKNGKFDEGEATLRLKLTLEEGKVDPVAYRIKYAPHHRTGDEWCIYPTYDYTHCLCDSIEDITHSLCTKEFQNRRSSYYWLCNSLDIYCPVQWEYGRLNVSYTVVSKRKIAKLIETGVCADWDDPRLFTLTALRRRGFPAEAINNFCARMGVTGAMMVVDPSMLEAVVRSHLDTSAPRTMVVLEPLKINLTNLVANVFHEINVPNFPTKPEAGEHPIAFGSVIYIEQSDFKQTAGKDFRRLTTNQPVGLKYAGYVIKVNKVYKGKDDQVTEIDAEAVPADQVEEKPKAFIHWVADPLAVELRLYERLFMHKNPEDPAEVPGGFLTDINRDSLKVLRGYADKHVAGSKTFDRFQFERVGFFSVDPDTKKNKGLVFNRTVSLKEDSKKA